jgi:bifunctional DNA-binding transcriptional regulator/antitoxin component of YhaV-PrlF toxin-antitoxin module
VPKPIRDALGIRDGDVLDVQENGARIMLTRLERPTADVSLGHFLLSAPRIGDIDVSVSRGPAGDLKL